MITTATPQTDARDEDALLAEALARLPGYSPDWQPQEGQPGMALLRVAARYAWVLRQRLNAAPDRNKLAFLDRLGIDLVPAQAARVPVVFRLQDGAADTRAPAATRLAVPPPPDVATQIVFETERAVGLAAAKLAQVVSLWPGRDQYMDHSAALAAGQPFTLFDKAALLDMPHHLYLAHNTLLALAGSSTVLVTFELATPGSEALDLLWEYWDGKVWRPFRDMSPECGEASRKLDGTLGLRASGSFRLEAECAESAQTVVNGVEACWIRARLDEPLPPDPRQILPEVYTLKLSTVLANPLAPSWSVEVNGVEGRGDALDNPKVSVAAQDSAGLPLEGVLVGWTPAQGGGGQTSLTNENGIASFSPGSRDPLIVSATWSGATTGYYVDLNGSELSGAAAVEIAFTLDPGGLRPDAAFTDANKVDVTKPFYPLGQQPVPGAALYFSSAEIFSKPGAQMRVYVQKAATPQEQTSIQGGTRTDLQHSLSWEYWNGRAWRALARYISPATLTADPRDFTGTGTIDFVVPDDMALTKVNDQEALWMRVRLNSGGYGFQQEVTWNDGTNTFTYVIPQPPALSDFRLGYTWQYGPFHPEVVFSYNDFQYADRSAQNRWPGVPYRPFTAPADTTPALFLGFDGELPVDQLGLYFDVVEQRGESEGPALDWQYWDGFDWADLAVEDETQALRVPGIVSLIGPEDGAALARFGTALYWLRAQLKEDGPPGKPQLLGIYPNATWAVQLQTIVNETLGTPGGGAFTGLPNAVFTFRMTPVVAGERLEVREVSGARANVEWRLVAREVLGDDARALRRLESLLAAEGNASDIEWGDVRLRRDRQKRVTEVWVRWYAQPHLYDSGPNDRHYVVDRLRGRARFGDGVQGKAVPPGAVVVARQYRTGGGLAGNLASGTITQLLAGIPGVEAVFNPRPAEGGADAETLAAFTQRGPRTLRHRGRALTALDYETMAREASAAVGWARAIPTRDIDGRRMPGWVTLLILPRGEEVRPWPSFGLREAVRSYIAARAPAGLGAAGQLVVTGPDFLTVDVEATLRPADPSEAGVVLERVRQALTAFLQPLTGGPNGSGWDLGRDLYLSDVAAVIERTEGVDYVVELTLSVEGRLHPERVPVPDGRVVVAGDIRLKLILDG